MADTLWQLARHICRGLWCRVPPAAGDVQRRSSMHRLVIGTRCVALLSSLVLPGWQQGATDCSAPPSGMISTAQATSEALLRGCGESVEFDTHKPAQSGAYRGSSGSLQGSHCTGTCCGESEFDSQCSALATASVGAKEPSWCKHA